MSYHNKNTDTGVITLIADLDAYKDTLYPAKRVTPWTWRHSRNQTSYCGARDGEGMLLVVVPSLLQSLWVN